MSKKIKIQKMTDYNIEYAHIYTDERFGEEQEKGVKELHKIITKLKKLNSNYVTTILIDDFNPTTHTLDVNDFLKKLEKINAKPDFILFESKLANYKNLLLDEMGGKLKKEYKNYIEKHKKIPCSFLIAIWDLKRLGLISTKKEELTRLRKNNGFIAKKIITILPKKYQEVERKVLKIIKSTKFKEQIKNMKNIFY